jgi:hypothetical protein
LLSGLHWVWRDGFFGDLIAYFILQMQAHLSLEPLTIRHLLIIARGYNLLNCMEKTEDTNRIFFVFQVQVSVIAESKGAIGYPSKLTSDKKKGKEQVQNVNPHGATVRADGGRLVLATNLRHEAENPRFDKDSCITVVDPESGDNAINVKVTPDEITLHSYCKLLSLCGLTAVGNRLLKGDSFEMERVLDQQLVEIGGQKIFPLLHRNSQTLGIDANIANILFRNGDGLAIEINENIKRLEISSIYSDDTVLKLPNGVIYGESDQRKT